MGKRVLATNCALLGLSRAVAAFSILTTIAVTLVKLTCSNSTACIAEPVPNIT